jgi:hypothetical protein
MNHGKFDGEQIWYVFTLIRRPNEQTVLVALSDGDSYKLTTLVRPTKEPYFGVVNVFPPGKCREFYTRKPVSIPTESVAVEAIGHSITLFYSKNGKWKSLLISA